MKPHPGGKLCSPVVSNIYVYNIIQDECQRHKAWHPRLYRALGTITPNKYLKMLILNIEYFVNVLNSTFLKFFFYPVPEIEHGFVRANLTGI